MQWSVFGGACPFSEALDASSTMVEFFCLTINKIILARLIFRFGRKTVYYRFEVMKEAKWHNFQVLTKRPDRLLALNDRLDWAANIWIGVSVESQQYNHRIDALRKTNAAIKFLSIEPLLGPIEKLDLNEIDWVIDGLNARDSFLKDAFFYYAKGGRYENEVLGIIGAQFTGRKGNGG